MRKPIVVLGSVLLAVASAALLVAAPAESPDSPSGDWRARISNARDVLEMDLSWGDEHTSAKTSIDVPLSSFEGFDREKFNTWGAPLHWEWPRKSGKIVFEGKGRWFWMPSGTFTFEPDPEWLAQFRTEDSPPPRQATLIRLAIFDLSTGIVDGLRDLGYGGVDLDEAIRLADHGIDLDYIAAAQQLGYRPAVEDLVRLRNNGMDAARFAAFASMGLTGIPVEDHIELLRHGISAEWVAGMAKAGILPSDIRTLVHLRDQGIDPGTVAAFRAIPGFTLSPDDLVRLQRHGIDAGFFGEMANAGISNLSVEGVISAHDNGLDPAYSKEMAGLGRANLEDQIQLARHGVGTDLVRGLHDAGYDRFSVTEVLKLSDHGISAGMVKQLAEAGYTDLSSDELVEINNRGISDFLVRRKQR